MNDPYPDQADDDQYSDILHSDLPEGAVVWDMQTRPDGVWLAFRHGDGRAICGMVFTEAMAKEFRRCLDASIEHRWGGG